MLLIHGAGGTSSKWRRLLPYLRDVPYQTIDLPGHGQNSGKPHENSIEEMARQIKISLAGKIIAVGHSMGGLIALELAHQYQDTVGVVLLASHYRVPVHSRIFEQLEQGIFPESLFKASYAPDVDPQLLAEEREELGINSMEVIKADFLAVNSYNNGETALRNLRVPLLVIYGSEDRLLVPDAQREILRCHPRAEVITIEGSGHYPQLERPAETAAALLKFRQYLQEAVSESRSD